MINKIKSFWCKLKEECEIICNDNKYEQLLYFLIILFCVIFVPTFFIISYIVMDNFTIFTIVSNSIIAYILIGSLVIISTIVLSTIIGLLSMHITYLVYSKNQLKMINKFFDYLWKPQKIQPISLKFLFFDWVFMSLLLILVGYLGGLIFAVILYSVLELIGINSILIEFTCVLLFSFAVFVFITHTSATITNKIFKKDLILE